MALPSRITGKLWTNAIFANLGIIRKQQGQLLTKHQYTGRNQCHKIPTVINTSCQLRDIFFLGFLNRSKIAQFQLGHAATTLFLRNRDRNAIVLQH